MKRNLAYIVQDKPKHEPEVLAARRRKHYFVTVEDTRGEAARNDIVLTTREDGWRIGMTELIFERMTDKPDLLIVHIHNQANETIPIEFTKPPSSAMMPGDMLRMTVELDPIHKDF